MRLVSVSPVGMSKYLVGEKFVLEVAIDSDKEVVLELHSNINRKRQVVEMQNRGNVFVVEIELVSSGFFSYEVRYRENGGEARVLLDEKGGRVGERIQVDPSWISKAIVYNVFVRFFKGKVLREGEEIHPGEGGTFDDVKGHLDELAKMGINTLYFNPIHLIGELYRKYNQIDQLADYLQPGSPYSIKDYKSIDPELTYDRDSGKHLLSDPQKEFADLIEAAHARGMYVIMDLVFNHTAHDFVFQRIRPEWYYYKEHIMSLEDPFIYPEEIKEGKPWGDPRHTLSPYDHGMWWEDAAQLNWHYMHPQAPNDPPVNSSIDEMWEYFKSIPKYWIRHFGVDGFRCDIAYRVPAKFWKECIAEARIEAFNCDNTLASDVVFIAEAMTNDLPLLQEAGFTAVYGDYSNKLARPLELNGYLDYMYNISGTHFPTGSKWFIFPECHDFSRAPQKILGEQAGRDLTADLLANKSRWLLTATLPGIPLIFNGFEKIEWQPINLFSYGAVDWESDRDLSAFISQVNYIRNEHVALQRGSYYFLHTNQGLRDTTQIFAFLRSFGEETILVVVNMDVYRAAGPATIYLTEQFAGKFVLKDLLTGKEFEREGQELLIQLPPGEAHIFLFVGC